ncbi:MAG: hypothetical protein IJC19_09045 [Clostridia bacterium]|nr:hypothetical protein [Clostridia bacterium]
MKREWSFHRPASSKRRIVLLILGGIALFVLGFFTARPVFMLLGLL